MKLDFCWYISFMLKDIIVLELKKESLLRSVILEGGRIKKKKGRGGLINGIINIVHPTP